MSAWILCVRRRDLEREYDVLALNEETRMPTVGILPGGMFAQTRRLGRGARRSVPCGCAARRSIFIKQRTMLLWSSPETGESAVAAAASASIGVCLCRRVQILREDVVLWSLCHAHVLGTGRELVVMIRFSDRITNIVIRI